MASVFGVLCSVGGVTIATCIHSNNEFPLHVACIFMDVECSVHIVTISTGSMELALVTGFDTEGIFLTLYVQYI